MRKPREGGELRATIYARVSTGLQAEEGTSIQRQIEAGLRAANELQAQVMHIRSDEGVSGALYYSRPAIQAAIADIKSGASNLLILYRIDRQGRDYDVINRVEKEVERYGGRIHYASGMNYENTAIGRFQKNNEKNMAVFERDIIRERTVNGRRAKAEREQQQPSRRFHPFGYHIVTKADVIAGRYAATQLGKYVIRDDQAPWLKLIFARYDSGHSLRAICRELEDNVVPTPRGGKQWSAATLCGILDNPVYYGRPAFGRRQRRVDEERLHETSRQTQKPKREYYIVDRPEEEWIYLEAPPLVSKEAWDRCQLRRKDNIERLGGNPERRFLLSTLLRCPNCGRGMYGGNARQRNHGPSYYRCTDYNRAANSKRIVCNPTRYHADKVDKTIIDAIVALAERPEEIEQALEAYERHHRSAPAPNNERERLEGELKQLHEEQRAAVTAQIHGIQAGMDPSVYEEVFQDLATRRVLLERRLAGLTDTIPAVAAPRTTAEKYRVVLDAVRDTLVGSGLTPAEKHRILTTLVRQIVPQGDDTFAIHLKGMTDSVKNIEVIQWFRRWDDWSEDELGVPDNLDRSMLIDEWREERRKELP